jgi:hypothetical protein
MDHQSAIDAGGIEYLFGGRFGKRRRSVKAEDRGD